MSMGSFYNIKILYGIKFANSRVIDYLIFRLITQNEFLFCKTDIWWRSGSVNVSLRFVLSIDTGNSTD